MPFGGPGGAPAAAFACGGVPCGDAALRGCGGAAEGTGNVGVDAGEAGAAAGGAAPLASATNSDGTIRYEAGDESTAGCRRAVTASPSAKRP